MYKCSWCNQEVPGDGLHSVTCQLSGAIGRGHSALKLAIYKIAKAAGMDVALEVSPPGNTSVRPADLLFRNWQGTGPLAVDFTVISPFLRNAPERPRVPTSRLDVAADLKIKTSRDVCRQAGWQFLPFVADTYGAIRADARKFVGVLIDALKKKVVAQPQEHISQQVWRTVSAAAISRAAQQLSQEQKTFMASQGLVSKSQGHGQFTLYSQLSPDTLETAAANAMPSQPPPPSPTASNPAPEPPPLLPQTASAEAVMAVG
jgi:hypothetical protein